jgi:pyruvate carboxylase
MLAAANAGADAVDAAMDAMAGTSSQPSMGAIVGALAGNSQQLINMHQILYWLHGMFTFLIAELMSQQLIT